jgi:hypothetical protein
VLAAPRVLAEPKVPVAHKAPLAPKARAGHKGPLVPKACKVRSGIQSLPRRRLRPPMLQSVISCSIPARRPWPWPTRPTKRLARLCGSRH